jgi:hypothetical protein
VPEGGSGSLTKRDDDDRKTVEKAFGKGQADQDWNSRPNKDTPHDRALTEKGKR